MKLYSTKLKEAWWAFKGLFYHLFVYDKLGKKYNSFKHWEDSGRKGKPPKGYMYFNTDEEDFWDNNYGIYELVDGINNDQKRKKFYGFSKIRKRLISYHWLALRNPTWNKKLDLGQHLKGVKRDVKITKNTTGDNKPLKWQNKSSKPGIKKTEWMLNGKKYWRWSCTLKFRFYMIPFQLLIFILGGFKWRNYFNIQWGAGDTRYHSKFRIFKR